MVHTQSFTEIKTPSQHRGGTPKAAAAGYKSSADSILENTRGLWGFPASYGLTSLVIRLSYSILHNPRRNQAVARSDVLARRLHQTYLL
jgi:hypothetical protein